jgi:hypothetical protein
MMVLAGRPQKKRRKPGCAFLHSVFKEQAPPQSGEDSLLRWFWSFHRRESGRGSPNRRCPWFVPQSIGSPVGCTTSSVRDKSKVPGGQKDFPRPFTV